MKKPQITYSDFEKLDIRVGKVIAIDDFPQARNPAYKLTIDFGPEIGIKRSSAQFAKLYKKEEILGRLVLGVVNFPPKQIGPFISETLTLGVTDSESRCILAIPDKDSAVIGSKLY